MKKKYKIGLAVTVVVILFSYMSYKYINRAIMINYNKKIIGSVSSKLPNDFFEYDVTYALFSDTIKREINLDEGGRYISKLNGSKIEKLYHLDKPYNVISYNQNDKKLILYSETTTLIIDENGCYEEIADNKRLLSGIGLSISFMGDYYVVRSSWNNPDESYPTIEYSHTINLAGLNYIGPIGLTKTDTKVIYD